MPENYGRNEPCVCGFGEEFFTLEGERHICTICGGTIARDMADSLLAGSMVAPGKNVLIVDDQAFFRERIKGTLRDEGSAVLEAADGLSGIKVLTEAMNRVKGGLSDRVDAVILDLVMPGVLDGVQTLAVMKVIYPELPVLILTATPPTKDLLTKLASFGAKKYINKAAGNLDQLIIKNIAEL